MYIIENRIRYSEADQDRQLKLGNILNYFQDCSTFQSEDLNLGLEMLKGRHRAWLLNSWQLEILRRPKLGETVQTGTYPYDFKAFYGYRNFFMRDMAGKYLVKANSVWFYVDTDSGRPVKASEDEIRGYEREPRLDMGYSGRKLQPVKEGEKGVPITIGRNQIDTNHHVNNAQYVFMAQETLPAGFMPSRLRVEYKKAAVLGDVLHPVTAHLQDGYAVTLYDEGGLPCTAMEFLA